MEWQVIVAIVVVIPFILIPVLFVWYLNIGGIFAAIKKRRAAREESKKMSAEAKEHIAVAVTEQSAEK